MVTAAAACLLVTLVALGGSAGWLLSDRAARQREADARVRDADGRVEEALATAEPLLREGDPANLVLVSAAQRVRAQLDGGAVGPEVRRRAEQLLRDVQMLADLDEARLHLAETRDGVSSTSRDGAVCVGVHFIRDRCAGPGCGGGGGSDSRSVIHEALLAGLDGWMEVKGLDSSMVAKPGDSPAGAPARMANAADDNAWRRAFREAVLAADRQKLKALAEQPEAWPNPRPFSRGWGRP